MMVAVECHGTCRLNVMPAKTVSMDFLIDQLEASLTGLEWEVDRNWLWITSNLAPEHKGKCDCNACTYRALMRKNIGKEGLGFIYAKHGHKCPSGAISYWSHHCEVPTRFIRKHKSGQSKDQADNTPEPERISDAELLALIGD